MKLFYRPNIISRYFGLIQHYEHIAGNKGYYTYSFGLWWIEIEFNIKRFITF